MVSQARKPLLPGWQRRRWRTRGLVLLAIVATVVAAPNRTLHWYPAAFVSLAPLFYLCWNQPFGKQLKICASICFGFCLLVFLPDPWAVEALTQAEIIAGLLVSPLVPLYFTMAALLSLWVSRPCPTWLRPCAIAAAWTGFDGLFAILQIPLPLHFGACLYDGLTVIQIADIAGIWGVTYFTILTNAAVAAGWIAFPRRGWWLPAVGVGLVWLAILTYGWQQLSRYAPTNLELGGGNPFIIGTVQQVTWLKTDRSWNYRTERYRELETFSKAALEEGAHLLVWPEGAMRAQLINSEIERLYLKPLLPSLPNGGGLIVGSSELANPNAIGAPWNERKFINAALLYTPDGTVRDRYGKQWLFQYFETSRFVPSQGGYRPLDAGDRLGLLGTQICLESVMPTASRRLVQRGAESLIVISDDSWFGNSNWPQLHSVLSVFRAIENRRSFAFVNNTGGNIIALPSGAIVAQGAIWEQGQVSGPMYRNRTHTFANRYGDWFVWLCLGGTTVSFGYFKFGHPTQTARLIAGNL
ncbi:MAG: apolipoprotein N-acyltransferase [Synechococcus sp.]